MPHYVCFIFDHVFHKEKVHEAEEGKTIERVGDERSLSLASINEPCYSPRNENREVNDTWLA
jgi:hypothetical protein